MEINSHYVVVERVEEEKKDGFQTVEVQDNFIYKGKIVNASGAFYIGNRPVSIGDVVIFAKYSPDTHEIEHDSKKIKFVKIADILGVL